MYLLSIAKFYFDHSWLLSRTSLEITFSRNLTKVRFSYILDPQTCASWKPVNIRTKGNYGALQSVTII